MSSRPIPRGCRWARRSWAGAPPGSAASSNSPSGATTSNGRNPPGERLSGDGNRIDALSLFANAAYDFPEFLRLRAYILAGAGPPLLVVRPRFDKSTRVDISDEALTASAQLRVDVRFRLPSRLELDLGFRYLVSAGKHIDGLATDYENNSFLAALSWSF